MSAKEIVYRLNEIAKELDKYHNEVIDFTATMKSIINRIVITRGMDKLDMNTK